MMNLISKSGHVRKLLEKIGLLIIKIAEFIIVFWDIGWKRYW